MLLQKKINQIWFNYLLTGDVTPPKIIWIVSRYKTNSTAELKWTFDEIVHSTCTLTTPNGNTKTFTCNNTWAETGLVEGKYHLKINSTDLEGNTAIHNSFWEVGKCIISLIKFL